MVQRFKNKVHFVIFIYIVVLVSHLSGLNKDYFKGQQKLIEDIIKTSDVTKEILPVENSSTPVLLKVGLAIRQIATVDEVNQAMRLNAWLRLYWNNPFLTWNPKDYNNVTSIHLDNALLWTPDISMFNKASLEEEIDILYKRLSTAVVLKYDGNCTWLSPATLLSQCKINVRQFPFDEQECLLIFGSWTYAAHQIDVVPGDVDLSDFVPNGEWVVLGYPMKRNVKLYGQGITFADVTLKFRIKRQPLYYTLNLIIPCTVIAILAFMSFVLPSNNGERVSLVITVLLAMSVYMLIVSSTLPQTSDAMPVIGTYFLCIIVEIALCLLATCFVAKLQDHESEMPKWLDKLVNKRLSRLLLMSAAHKDYEVSGNTRANGEQNLKILDTSLNDVIFAENDIIKRAELANQKGFETLRDELAILTNDLKKRRKQDAKKAKWQNAARVMDRFFLLLFSLIFVVVTAAVFS